MNRRTFINAYLYVILYLIKIVTSKDNTDNILSKAKIAESNFKEVLPDNFFTNLDTLHGPIKRRSFFLEPVEIRTCYQTEFKCRNERCIPLSWLCDNEDDCGDNTDEDHQACSSRTCSPNEFKCPNENCIPLGWLCDNEDDCGDNTDEDHQSCHAVTTRAPPPPTHSTTSRSTTATIRINPDVSQYVTIRPIIRTSTTPGTYARQHVGTYGAVPPKLAPLPQELEFPRGERFQLMCFCREGDHPLKFSWLRDGSAVIETQDVAVRQINEFSSFLTISALREDSAANYTCIVSNQGGSDSSTVKLTVLGIDVPCSCGEGMIKCLHHPDGKICECSNNRVVINGMCTDCECYNGVCIMVGEFRQCRCLRGFGLQDNTCVECQCGAKKRFCHFVEGLQFCNCDDEYISVNEKCEDCMCGKDEVCLKRPQIGVCTCPKGSGTWDDEECDECDCSDGKSCMYVGSQKLCTCMPRKAKLNGTCVECDCGENAECEFVDGEKTCSCQDGYEMHNGTCEECYCGEGHSCTFKNGSSVCICAENYYAHNGTCKSCTCGPSERCEIIDGKQFCICKENFIKINNTCIECWCGEGHTCNIVDGKKLCLCQEGFADNNGKCEKCDCGANYASCEFQNGKKECECHEGYASNNGICQECFCGKNSTCLFENGEKLCFCPEDQQQSNGMCIVWMCLDDTCHRGTCEVNENGFFCNCEDGYSGHRCDEGALLSQGAIYLISVLSALTLFWVILLLVFIIRKRNRYRHYHHEKLDATMNVLSEENPDSAM